MTREAEFDHEQYLMFAALHEFEAGLGPHGLPIEETTSPDADPGNPNAKWHYETVVLRDFAASAVEEREQDFKDNPSRARIFLPIRVDH